ncbi:MAG: hypothetical protein US96_C0009G0001, partial [Candidatus Woesebacteria bacterium GW2011_GWB1_38_5b]
MAKRGSYGKRLKFRVKLKKKTIYTIFGFGSILLSVFIFLSFIASGPSFEYINSLIRGYFGPFSFFLPIVFILFGFLFFRLKFSLSRPNVAVGFMLVYVSVVMLFRSGYVGAALFQNISDVIRPVGTLLVSLTGIVIGLIVLFDTSLDEILKGIRSTNEILKKLIPVSLFKKKKDFLSNKPMIVKGEGKGPIVISNNIKKDDALISEKLVSNKLSSGLIWEYPPLDLLSEDEGH